MAIITLTPDTTTCAILNLLAGDYIINRYYGKADTTSLVGSEFAIDSAEVIFIAPSTLVGAPLTTRLRSSKTGYGDTLTDSIDDWNSITTLEDDLVVNAIGSLSYNVTPGNLNTTGSTYFRLSTVHEGSASTKVLVVNTSNNSVGKPVLRVTINDDLLGSASSYKTTLDIPIVTINEYTANITNNNPNDVSVIQTNDNVTSVEINNLEKPKTIQDLDKVYI